jgi:DNA-binding CsgD family transcriptional regulator
LLDSEASDVKNWREDYLHRLTRPAQSEADTFDELAHIAQELGFEYCSFGMRVPVLGEAPLEFWSTTYPESWQIDYMAHGYMRIDPTIEKALRNPLPVIWTDELFSGQRAFWEDAQAHDVRHGWTVATYGQRSSVGLLSLARSHDGITSQELAEVEAKLMWAAHTANGMIGTRIIQKLSPAASQELTQREREVLRWTAAGKTSAEIGVILGISTRTVNFHILTVFDKLGVVNKTQAAVKAQMNGMLY